MDVFASNPSTARFDRYHPNLAGIASGFSPGEMGKFGPGIWVMSRKNKYGLYKVYIARSHGGLNWSITFGTSHLHANGHVSYAPTPNSYQDLHRLESKRRSEQDAES